MPAELKAASARCGGQGRELTQCQGVPTICARRTLWEESGEE
jgi:hypothetical protein